MTAIPEAAGVVLARGPAADEVLVVRRSDSLRFFGGYLAFPGGRVAADDAAVAARFGTDPRRVAAVRELFEETGVLLARRTDGSFPPTSDPLDRARRDLLADRLAFDAMLAQLGVRLDPADLVAAGTLVTPPFSSFRFDTAFFVARLPEGQVAEIWPGELAEGAWTTARALLDAWTRGECRVTPPTVTFLELLRDGSAFDLPTLLAPLLARLDAGNLPPIPFAPGVHMLPLHTIALAPAQYTNAFLVGNERRWLIDPGAHDPAEQQRLFDALDPLLAQGGTFAGVLVTHWHPDHVGAVDAVAQRYGVPVWSHPLTPKYLPDGPRITRFLDEGDHIDLGTTPDGRAKWHLEPLLTPGHAAGHLAFYDPYYRLLFAADLWSSLTSVVIAAPDGDLGVYLESLRRVRDLDCRLMLAGHGPPTIRPVEAVDDTLAHRAKREAQLVAALEEAPATLEQLTARLYEGLAEGLRVLARLQVQAGLEKLRREGRAKEESGQWSVASGQRRPDRALDLPARR